MTRILAIETSAEACSVALNDGEVIAEHFAHAPMQHAELILPYVTGLLDQADWRMKDLDVIAFGRGPGSFTSLRIGIGVVQGLAWGAELGVVPVSSLQVVAQMAVRDESQTQPQQDYVLVAMDARMGEVFHAGYRVDDESWVVADTDETVSPPEQLKAPGNGLFIAAGNGFARYDALTSLGNRAQRCMPDVWPRASMVLELAQRWLQQNEALPPEMAQPVYIRNDVALKTSER